MEKSQAGWLFVLGVGGVVKGLDFCLPASLEMSKSSPRDWMAGRQVKMGSLAARRLAFALYLLGEALGVDDEALMGPTADDNIRRLRL